MKNRTLILLAGVFLAVSCTVTHKTAGNSANINFKDFFPLENGCSWIYLVGKEKTQYHVKILAADSESGMIVWGNKTFSYVHKNDGVYNATENYYIMKSGDSKWDINKGTAEYVELKDEITVKAGSYKAIAVKETYPEKKFYTVSYYGYKTGLIKFEVFTLDGEHGTLIEKMELGNYICSDSD
ncbi:MAG TPA: hypothetical protein PKG52_04490 [bacterium]|nr:hypothetical protein [bacterium]HPS29269.1 hypothetical protein [bacterium]